MRRSRGKTDSGPGLNITARRSGAATALASHSVASSDPVYVDQLALHIAPAGPVPVVRRITRGDPFAGVFVGRPEHALLRTLSHGAAPGGDPDRSAVGGRSSRFE